MGNKLTRYLFIIFFCITFISSISGCTPHYRLNRLREAIQSFHPEKKPPAPLTFNGYRDYRGVIHVHSYISHDSEGRPEEIINAAKEAGLYYIVMTDHNDPEIFTEGMNGWYDDILVVRGMEIIKGCPGPTAAHCSSVLLIGIDEYIDPHKFSYQEIFDRVNNDGGIIFIAHPQGFKDWDVTGYHGMEIYDILDDAVDNFWKFPKYFFDVIYSYNTYPQEVFLSILDRPVFGLQQWDKLLKSRKITAIGGNDSHQNVKVLGRQLDPYDLSFSFVNNHVFAPVMDKDNLMDALKRGHSYVSFDILADPTGFNFFAIDDREVKGIMGDDVELSEGTILKAEIPFKGNIRLIRDGVKVKEEIAEQLEFMVEEEGVYRVEADIEINRRWRPWIFSNPIYIKENDNVPSAIYQEDVLLAGASKFKITPVDEDGRLWEEPYIDINKNERYDAPDPLHPDAPYDKFIDENSNGKWDGPYLAGFWHNRSYYTAAGVHDDLWARALILQHGDTKIGMVSLDIVGYFYQYVEEIREAVSDLALTGLIIASTHTHGGTDSMGLWGPNRFTDGKDPRFIDYIKRQAIASLRKANKRLRTARIKFGEKGSPIKFGRLINDFRDPVVIDDRIRVMKIDDMEGETIATVINWSPHPETMGGSSSLITSDFPHYLREGVEKGGFYVNREEVEGIGGIAIYFSGAVGGLMTTLNLDIRDEMGEILPQRSWQKTKRISELAAWTVIESIRDQEYADIKGLDISLKKLFIPMDNMLLKDLNARGVIKRDTYTNGKRDGVKGDDLLTEVGAITFLGDSSVIAQIITIPGELFPEIAMGGFLKESDVCFRYTDRKRELDGIGKERVAPAHKDILPESVLMDHMKGRYKFIFGLANDELGYIIPANDFVPPRYKPSFAYGVDRCGDNDHYEETVSSSSRLAPMITDAIVEILTR